MNRLDKPTGRKEKEKKKGSIETWSESRILPEVTRYPGRYLLNDTCRIMHESAIPASPIFPKNSHYLIDKIC